MSFYGIINFSNNCYLNVILQMLINNKYTRNIILDDKYLKIKNNLLDPSLILELIKDDMNINIQNDAQETLTLLTDKIPEINKCFEGKISSRFFCNKCKKYRIKDDKFITLNLYEENMENNFKNLFKNENHYLDCDFCKKNTNTTIEHSISTIGNLLVFYNILKIKIEINNIIIFNENTYKLIGYIKHLGRQNYGHYLYYDVINKLIIDDSNITKFDKHILDDIYLVIYEKE